MVDKVNSIKEQNFLTRYVKPHTKVSREVTEADVPRVVEEAHVLYNLCFTQTSRYAGAYAVAHPQIDDKDPLRFFVTKDKMIVINPVITRHTHHLINYREGCTSFPDKAPVVTQRWNKCEMDYQTLEDDGKGGVKLSDKIHAELEGHDAKVVQHEIDHLCGVLLYK